MSVMHSQIIKAMALPSVSDRVIPEIQNISDSLSSGQRR